MLVKKGILKNFAIFIGKHLCPKTLQLYWKQTPIHVIFCEICEIFKNTFFYSTPPVAATEKPISEDIRNSPCLYDKGNRATYGLRWRMRATTTKVHKLNYQCNLDWLKRYSEIFLQWISLEKRLFINLSKENKHLHNPLSTTRTDPTNLKWIPPPRILRESSKLERNLHHKNIWCLRYSFVGTHAIKTDNLIKWSLTLIS